MKFILFSVILFFNLYSLAQSEPFYQVEAHCWNSAVDSDSSFLCQYLVVSGKTVQSQGFQYPELQAPDQGGPLSELQAERACQLLGFAYALRFELSQPAQSVLQVRLTPDGQGEVLMSSNAFIQHLNCAD